jgi:hypothetical protein
LTEFALGRVGLIPIDVVALILLIRLYYRRTGSPRAAEVPPGARGALARAPG